MSEKIGFTVKKKCNGFSFKFKRLGLKVVQTDNWLIKKKSLKFTFLYETTKNMMIRLIKYKYDWKIHNL